MPMISFRLVAGLKLALQVWTIRRLSCWGMDRRGQRQRVAQSVSNPAQQCTLGRSIVQLFWAQCNFSAQLPVQSSCFIEEHEQLRMRCHAKGPKTCCPATPHIFLLFQIFSFHVFNNMGECWSTSSPKILVWVWSPLFWQYPNVGGICYSSKL